MSQQTNKFNTESSSSIIKMKMRDTKANNTDKIKAAIKTTWAT